MRIRYHPAGLGSMIIQIKLALVPNVRGQMAAERVG